MGDQVHIAVVPIIRSLFFRRLSEICFLVGMFLMVVALFMDNTFYVLNLYVQSIGQYIFA